MNPHDRLETVTERSRREQIPLQLTLVASKLVELWINLVLNFEYNAMHLLALM